MKIEANEIEVNGVTYVPKGSEPTPAVDTNGLPYVIIRGDRSGVFAGYLKERSGREVLLHNCRRLWYWSGAASLSQLANEGVKNPDKCKFTQTTPKHKILDAIEVIGGSEKARKCIEGVSEWVV